MLSTLLTVSLLVARIAAQGYSFPAGFDLSLVDEDKKDDWCQAQRNSCPMICPDGSARENNCNPSDLSFTCVCGDGSTPDIAEYISTIPFFVCKENQAQCIKKSGGSLKAERACNEAAKECGTENPNKDVDDDEETTTSSPVRATRTSASTSETVAATTTAETAPASPTDEDDDNAAAGQTYSMGLMAAAFAGVLGFLA